MYSKLSVIEGLKMIFFNDAIATTRSALWTSVDALSVSCASSPMQNVAHCILCCRRMSLTNAAAIGDTIAIQRLLMGKADVEERSSDYGSTALMKASRFGHLEAVKCLLAANADVNLTNTYGRFALWLAARNGKRNVCELLLAAKADVNMHVMRQTALDVAVMRKKNSVVELLRKWKAKQNLTQSAATDGVATDDSKVSLQSTSSSFLTSSNSRPADSVLFHAVRHWLIRFWCRV